MDVQQPVVSSMPTPTPVTETSQRVVSTPPKRYRKGLCIALIIILLLAGGAAAAYYYVTVFAQTPERVFGRMLGAMNDVTSVRMDVTLDGDGRGVPTSPLYTNDGDAVRTPVDTELAANANVWFGKATAQRIGDVTLSAMVDGVAMTELAAEIRSIEAIDYVRLSMLTTPMMPPVLEKSKTTALNRWIVIDKAALAKSLRLETLFARSVEVDADAVSATVAEHLSRIVVITATLPSETVDGVTARHYAYAIDKNATGDMLDALSARMNGETFDEVRAFLGETNDITGELWIGKSDAFLRKVTAETSMKGGQRFALRTTMLLSEYGSTVEVDKPNDATSIEDVMLEILTEVAEQADADDDADGLTNGEEARYESDAANPDTDGDGYQDGAEVDGGYNPNGSGKLPVAVIEPEFFGD